MKKVTSILTLATAFLFLSTQKALAVCPVCTVAVVGGLGLSRYLGIDDLVSSVWIGGLLLSVSFWSIDWLEKKYHLKTKFKYLEVAVIIFWYGLTLIPLIFTKVIGHPFNTVWGIDKIVLGTLIGSLVFLLGVWGDQKVRQIKGRQLFIYQKVVFPVVALIITSLILFFLNK